MTALFCWLYRHSLPNTAFAEYSKKTTKKEKNSRSSLLYPLRGYNVLGFMRLKRLFRYIRFRIGSTLLSHFVAMGG